MSPGFVKGFLVTGVVFGFQSLLWGTYFLFRADGRAKAIQSFLRGGFSILFFSVAYYFFTLGFFEGLSDLSTIVILCGFSAFLLLLEIALQGGPNKMRSPEPMTAALWQQRKVTKWQMILMMTLVPVYILLTAAVVFRIVAPEVLELRWWLLIIVASSLGYFLFALRLWNANERKFGSQQIPPK